MPFLLGKWPVILQSRVRRRGVSKRKVYNPPRRSGSTEALLTHGGRSDCPPWVSEGYPLGGHIMILNTSGNVIPSSCLVNQCDTM